MSLWLVNRLQWFNNTAWYHFHTVNYKNCQYKHLQCGCVCEIDIKVYFLIFSPPPSSADIVLISARHSETQEDIRGTTISNHYPAICHIISYSFSPTETVVTWWRHQMEHFPRYWPFVRGIHRSPVNNPHKDQWLGALMCSFICASINGWVNTREAGDLRCHRAHYDIIVMTRVSVTLSFQVGMVTHPNLIMFVV